MNELKYEFTDETARHRYNTLYEQIDRCNLVEDYEEWEWLTEDGDE